MGHPHPQFLSFVDLFAVAYRNDEHDQPVLLDLAEDAVVSHAITPYSGVIVPEWFAEYGWILSRSDALTKITQDEALCRLIQADSIFSAPSSNSILQAKVLLDLLQRKTLSRI